MAQDTRSAGPTGVGSKPWIKMRTDLWDDPRVAALCDALEADEARVIGGLYRLWSIGDAHSTDGHLPGMTADTIARKTGIPGIAHAMEAVGWLCVDEGGVTIPDFCVHNGQSAKCRAQNSLRQQSRRSRKQADATVSRSKRDSSATKTRQSRDNRVTRKEKREEPPPPAQSAEHAGAPAPDDSVGRAEAVEALAETGLADADGAAGAASERGYSPAQVRAVIAHWRTLSGVGLGALAWRLGHVPPDRPVTDGWPPGREPTATPAPEMDIGRYTATWSSLRPSRRSELARRAQVDLTGHEGQGLRELPSELRQPLIEVLAREAGRGGMEPDG